MKNEFNFLKPEAPSIEKDRSMSPAERQREIHLHRLWMYCEKKKQDANYELMPSERQTIEEKVGLGAVTNPSAYLRRAP